LTWSGGRPPYQLETSPRLDPLAPWQIVPVPDDATNAAVPFGEPHQFYRIRGQQIQ